MQTNKVAQAIMRQASTTTQRQQIFSADDKDAIAYFFMRLQNVFGTPKMRAQWPDDEILNLARREFGKEIAKFGRDQIDEAFQHVHKERRSGNPRFEWPNIDAILGLLTNEGVFTGSAGIGAHKIYAPELPSSTKTERKQMAKTGIANMREALGF